MNDNQPLLILTLLLHFCRGKWYEYPNKDQELSDNDVQANYAGPNGGSMGVAASGREWTSSGTEGQFDIYHGNTKVCHVYWDCPWSHKHNSFSVSEVDDNYVVQDTGASLDSGALGSITIKVVKTSETEETKCIWGC